MNEDAKAACIALINNDAIPVATTIWQRFLEALADENYAMAAGAASDLAECLEKVSIGLSKVVGFEGMVAYIAAIREEEGPFPWRVPMPSTATP